jgi:hypothetical protein
MKSPGGLAGSNAIVEEQARTYLRFAPNLTTDNASLPTPLAARLRNPTSKYSNRVIARTQRRLRLRLRSAGIRSFKTQFPVSWRSGLSGAQRGVVIHIFLRWWAALTISRQKHCYEKAPFYRETNVGKSPTYSPDYSKFRYESRAIQDAGSALEQIFAINAAISAQNLLREGCPFG